MGRIETHADWLELGTKLKIDELGCYLRALDGQMKSMADNYDDRIEAQAQEIGDEEERQDFYEFASEEHWNYRETFPADDPFTLGPAAARLKDGEVALEATTSSSPGVVRPVNSENYTHVVMPMFVQW